MPKTLLMSGFDLRVADFPDDVRVLRAPAPRLALADFRGDLARALDQPVAGAPPFAEQLRPGMRVAVVVDDFSLPVPPALHDPRREMLEVALRALDLAGVDRDRTSVLIANGLSRQWRPTELRDVLGEALVGARAVSCHDAEATSHLTRLGDEPEGPVEVHRALAEADLILHLNVVSMPLMAGLFGLVAGTAGYKTARWLAAPKVVGEGPNPLATGSAYQRIHERVAGHITRRAPVFQLSVLMNNEVWTPALAALLRSETGLDRPLQVWNALPAAVRHRAARLLKASYRPIEVLAGAPEAVGPLALERFLAQHATPAGPPVDVLMFGLPDLGPAAVGAAQNPVLAANLALGLVSNLNTGEPLLRQGGVLLFANPLTPSFDRSVHLPHEEFYEKVLRLERDPAAIHERFEPFFAGRPEFVSSYQRRFAFHGAHPLYAWYLCQAARRRAGRILVAHGDPRACARLGFTPVSNLEEGMTKAREYLELERPTAAVMELPPPFWVRAG